MYIVGLESSVFKSQAPGKMDEWRVQKGPSKTMLRFMFPIKYPKDSVTPR